MSFLGGGFIMTMPRCESCKWFDKSKFTCRAFPDSIPVEKLWGNDTDMCNGKYKYDEV